MNTRTKTKEDAFASSIVLSELYHLMCDLNVNEPSSGPRVASQKGAGGTFLPKRNRPKQGESGTELCYVTESTMRRWRATRDRRQTLVIVLLVTKKQRRISPLFLFVSSNTDIFRITQNNRCYLGSCTIILG